MKKKQQTVTGALSITSKGFGFIRTEQGPDVFISYDHLANGMDGDVVEARLLKKGQKPSGKIVSIVKRSDRPIIGVFRFTKQGGKVYPEDERLPSSLIVPEKEIKQSSLEGELRNGKIVMARLLQWSDPSKKPEGTIEQIIGDKEEPGVDLKVVALSRDLSLDFPRPVEQEAENIPLPEIDSVLTQRTDLRETSSFTIDPETAKDFDDAVSLIQLPSGLLELGVHIADVSHFVPENSKIDKEAWNRGTSVYLVNHVLPMLPEYLSNDICSLVPGKPRLTFSVIVELTSMGEARNYRIEETVIESKRRFTYKEVEAIINGKEDPFAPTIHMMQMLSQVLRKRREEQGSIDFDMTEQFIDLDDEGIPRMIQPKERLEAHKLVEEFMLLANRTVAEHIESEEKSRKEKIPFIYRIHEKPAAEDVEAFLSAVSNLGIPYKVGETVEPDDYRNILTIIENLDFKDFVEKIALQSMTKAVYSTENKGHFGLAFDAYTHFTSPIRRYPDLIVHRLLKRYLKKGRGRIPASPRLITFLERTCTQSSVMEKRAVGAEREYTKIKSLEFLSRKVGKVYQGVISGVTSFGLFVELSRYLIEGLVPISELRDDFYTFDEQQYRYVGEKTGKIYRLGDRVTVKIKQVSVEDRKADFILV